MQIESIEWKRARRETWLQYLRAECEQSEGSEEVDFRLPTVAPRDLRSSREADAGARPHQRERRRHPRMAPRYKVRIVTDCAKVVDGVTVNISDGGVLVSVSEWRDFQEDDLIGIALFQNDGNGEGKSSAIAAKLGVIRRVEKGSRRIAVISVQDKIN